MKLATHVLALFSGLFWATSAIAGSGDYVAQVTIRDVAGSTKRTLRKTTANRCDRRRRGIVAEMQRAVGIAEIVSSKCGPVGAMVGFFRKAHMGVPYVWMGDAVLIINGASPGACDGLAAIVRQSNKNAICIYQ